MIVSKKALFIFMVSLVAASISASFSKKLAHVYNGTAVHVFNQTSPTISTYGCSALERKKQVQLFGYDLGIEYHDDTDTRFFRPESRAVLYLHPWGLLAMPNKRHSHLLKMYNVVPGDVITFNFPDGIWRWPFPSYRSSFGQLPDVLVALYTLNYVYDTAGIRVIDLFGYSRGGAVAVNMVAVLHDTSGKYNDELARIGISVERAKELLSAIERGSLVLDCPLIDATATLQNYSRPVQFLAYTFTKFEKDGLHALSSAQSLSELKLNVLLHFQHGDKMIGNQNEAALYSAFARLHPEGTYLLMGNDGGHVHPHDSLAMAIHAFYKQVGGAYDTQKIPEYQAHARTCDNVCGKLVQPSIHESEELIRSFHQACGKN